MHFDRLGEQQVAKRRRPSPAKKARRASPPEEIFSQDVWRRQPRRGASPARGAFDAAWQAIFGGASPGNVERPARRKGAGFARGEGPGHGQGAGRGFGRSGGDGGEGFTSTLTGGASSGGHARGMPRAGAGRGMPGAGAGADREMAGDGGFAGAAADASGRGFFGMGLFGLGLGRGLGRGLSSPLLKAMALTLALLGIAVVSLNWDGISAAFSPAPGISIASLEDPIPPLYRRMPGFSPGGAHGGAIDAELGAADPSGQGSPWAALPFHSGRAEPEYVEISIEIPLSLTETFRWAPHVVAPGETISGIAARHSLSQGSIIALNDIRESWNLQIGRSLKIPNMDGIPHTVREGDTLGGIAERTGIPLNVLLDANNISSEALEPGQMLFIPGGRMDAGEFRRATRRAPERPLARPVRGRITSGFGWREDPFNPGSGRMELHRAVDLAGRMGEPVHAAMRGTVLHRGADPSLGNFIVLQHGEYQTLYAHLSAFSVAAGETVRQGQEIGRIGSTGRATGPHLHFALFRRGEPINPVDMWR